MAKKLFEKSIFAPYKVKVLPSNPNVDSRMFSETLIGMNQGICKAQRPYDLEKHELIGSTSVQGLGAKPIILI
ncbi:GrpB family protein [Paenibacillus allorhizosphaerae]|uniref:GrpB family protein n=1 Tax=Paenibacillus allorhizosphaerae TaxID=2849866 RepID=UPI001C402D4F|nr:GrpB family protein [Paenibacillus allorhizosphaerae]